ncbi:DUF1350 family protein [Leptothoe sp. PORK10 BA2]|uniref:DUF1350 family protein n=1 Tax=Leptothoe sp. PORK10 BA2 TaxID=3110254 RepID=UPI002B1EFC38|nr:DUF1350 family protein [Leptothoe sp. PORK10 BA2]MEA5465003.1 DUF1350 family protein [Leptothoe sp. PORK10 BA2]
MVLSSPNTAPFAWLPCAHSWVAIHPQPRGVIQFIGSGLWGVWPMVSYGHFLKSLFEAGYTIVAIPFRYARRHWSVALDLLDEHYQVRLAMVEVAMARGYDPKIYLDAAHYAWVGHGLGCRYVALLEVLTAPMELLSDCFQSLVPELEDADRQWQQICQGLASLGESLRLMERRIQRLTGETVDYSQPSIRHQASLLLAPVMTDLAGPLRSLLSKLMPVYPTVAQTHQLIEHSPLFQLTGLIQFARDRIAADTCQRLMQEQPHLRRRLLKGNYWEPVGIRMGQVIVDFNPLDKLVQPLSCRDLEYKSITLLNRLRTPSPLAPCPSGRRAKGHRAMAA